MRNQSGGSRRENTRSQAGLREGINAIGRVYIPPHRFPLAATELGVMVSVNDCVPAAARDEPAIDREGEDPGNEQR